MTPALQKRIAALIEALDDCWSRNAETANLIGLVRNARKLRTIREALRKEGIAK